MSARKKSKFQIELDDKCICISLLLKIPLRPYYSDKQGFFEMCEAFMKKGYELSMQFNSNKKKFGAVGIGFDDLYCVLTHADSFQISTFEAIYNRLRKTP